jgi:hypothetical protein
MVQALTPNRTNQPFDKRVLPGASRRGDDLFNRRRLGCSGVAAPFETMTGGV